MEQDLFDALCQREALGLLPRGAQGVGTLGERGVHRVIKLWLEPRPQYREVRVGRYVADIKNENGIFEIQTRHFSALAPKLRVFLAQDGPVTLVYPVAGRKTIRWVNPETGEVGEGRLSPKRGTAADILYELYAIRALLPNPALRFLVPVLAVDELRLLDGWGRGGKRGGHRAASLPVALESARLFSGPEDFAALLPPGLEEPFTAAALMKALNRRGGYGTAAAGALAALGVTVAVGKSKNAVLYRRAF